MVHGGLLCGALVPDLWEFSLLPISFGPSPLQLVRDSDSSSSSSNDDSDDSEYGHDGAHENILSFGDMQRAFANNMTDTTAPAAVGVPRKPPAPRQKRAATRKRSAPPKGSIPNPLTSGALPGLRPSHQSFISNHLGGQQVTSFATMPDGMSFAAKRGGPSFARPKGTGALASMVADGLRSARSPSPGGQSYRADKSPLGVSFAALPTVAGEASAAAPPPVARHRGTIYRKKQGADGNALGRAKILLGMASFKGIGDAFMSFKRAVTGDTAPAPAPAAAPAAATAGSTVASRYASFKAGPTSPLDAASFRAGRPPKDRGAPSILASYQSIGRARRALPADDDEEDTSPARARSPQRAVVSESEGSDSFEYEEDDDMGVASSPTMPASKSPAKPTSPLGGPRTGPLQGLASGRLSPVVSSGFPGPNGVWASGVKPPGGVWASGVKAPGGAWASGVKGPGAIWASGRQLPPAALASLVRPGPPGKGMVPVNPTAAAAARRSPAHGPSVTSLKSLMKSSASMAEDDGDEEYEEEEDDDDVIVPSGPPKRSPPLDDSSARNSPIGPLPVPPLRSGGAGWGGLMTIDDDDK